MRSIVACPVSGFSPSVSTSSGQRSSRTWFCATMSMMRANGREARKQNVSSDVAALIAGLGIGGLALALAARDTVANFFGSLVIFTDQPFHIGDWVEVGGVEGVVEEVGMRTTRIRRFDKSLATVPNQTFTTLDGMPIVH